MKALYFIALSLLIVSCKNQGKMDLEAAKTATVDSMGNGKAKSNRFHAGRNDKGRNPKGNYYNSESANNTTTTTTNTQKKGWSSTAKE
jgi:hypothetical protein